uniref:Zasp-like motif domain-containing protein n=1 Tax=Graphocephala atropunctata TaxID=36148 RepID=A0A1B6KKF4_9HEMI
MTTGFTQNQNIKIKMSLTRIDFHQLAKPANLSNSAVLRMLEEEESRGRGQGLKRVTWPPPPEETEFLVEEPPPVYAQAPVGQQATPAQSIQSFQRPNSSPVSFTPPPSTITLRASPPVSQASVPVYASQPITATVKGGSRSRGDQKWPPETVKQQSEVENQARIALAKGPACRPRRVQKDYSTFFAQHALNSTYPGYKAPPGTQHYIEEGTSNL